jgi:hypothetical protein
LQSVVKRTVDRGDQFVLASTLSPANQQGDFFFNTLTERFLDRWVYCKAAWAMENTPLDAGLVYHQMGWKGLESIENVGPSMAKVIESLLSPRR